MKKKTILTVLLLAALTGVWYLYQQKLVPAADVALRSTGTVKGLEVNITSKISGRIASLSFDEGDTVENGEVVLTLEDDDLIAQTRSSAAGLDRARAEIQVSEATLAYVRAGLENADAEILSADADLGKAKVQVKDAERHFEQMQNLYQQHSVSRESLDTSASEKETSAADVNARQAGLVASKARRSAANAQLQVAESQLALARTGVRQAEADLALWQAKLADTVIISPLSGTVVYKALEAGETVTPGMIILTLVDLKRLTVELDIDESQLGTLRLGGQVVLQTIGNPGKSSAGHITTINRYADFATQKDVTGGREDIRTFRVTIAVDTADASLSPGMTVKATIPVHTSEADDGG